MEDFEDHLVTSSIEVEDDKNSNEEAAVDSDMFYQPRVEVSWHGKVEVSWDFKMPLPLEVGHFYNPLKATKG